MGGGKDAPKKVEPKKEPEKKVEPKKEPEKKVEPKKDEPKKETKKEEPKKEDPKKADTDKTKKADADKTKKSDGEKEADATPPEPELTKEQKDVLYGNMSHSVMILGAFIMCFGMIQTRYSKACGALLFSGGWYMFFLALFIFVLTYIWTLVSYIKHLVS